MADYDNTRGSGRGTSRGRGRGRGRCTLPQPTIRQPIPPSNSLPPHSSTSQSHVAPQWLHSTPRPNVLPTSHDPTRKSTHSSTSHHHVTPQPSRSTPSQHVPSIPHAPMAHKPPQSTQVKYNRTKQHTHPSTSHTHVPPQHDRVTPSPLVLLTSHAPIAPEPTQPTPSPNNSTTQNQTIHPTPPQSHSQANVASVDTPQVSSHVDSYPEIESSEDDRRMWICPGLGYTFEPPIGPTREITKIIKKKFECSWLSYGVLKKKDEKMATMWFDEFKRMYKWLPEHEAAIKKIYDHKASEAYSNAMYRVRCKIDPGNWIPKKFRDELELKWADEDWKNKAIKNSNNRTSSDGSLHTGGSIPTTEHFKRLKNSSDETPTCWDLFERTHKMKGETPKWVSSKSEKIANEYESRILERDSQEALGDSVSNEQSDNNIFLEVVGGVSKKKRIPGLGPAGENYIPSSKRSTGISESEYLQIKSEYMQMKTENQSLREEVRGLYANQEKMLKFMETFYQSHPRPPSPPPPPPPTNEDDQQFDDEYDDELDV